MDFTGYSYLTLWVLLTSLCLVKSTEDPGDNQTLKDEIASLITMSRFEFDELNKNLAPYIDMEHRIVSVIAAIRRCRERNPNAYLGIPQASINALLDDASNVVDAMGNVSAFTKAASNELADARHWSVWCWNELTKDETKYTPDDLPYYCRLFYSHHAFFQLLMISLYGVLAQIRYNEHTLNCVNTTCTTIEALMENNYSYDLAEARKMVIKKWTNIVKKIDRKAKCIEADGNIDIEEAIRVLDDEDGDEPNIPTEPECKDPVEFAPYAYTAKTSTPKKNGLKRVLSFWQGTQNGETIGFTREHYLLMTGMAILAVTHCF